MLVAFNVDSGLAHSVATQRQNDMTILDTNHIENWHAHVYFDAASRDAAWVFRQEIGRRFGASVQLGRFHERPVGPHPQWSFQISFTVGCFTELISWLTLNHGALDIFVHPNTGDAVRDHRDSAVWIGRSYDLVLSALSQ